MSDQPEGGNATNEKKPRTRKVTQQFPPFAAATAQLPEAPSGDAAAPAAAPGPQGNFRCRVKDRSVQTKHGVAAAYSEVNLSAADAQHYASLGRVTILFPV